MIDWLKRLWKRCILKSYVYKKIDKYHDGEDVHLAISLHVPDWALSDIHDAIYFYNNKIEI